MRLLAPLRLVLDAVVVPAVAACAALAALASPALAQAPAGTVRLSLVLSWEGRHAKDFNVDAVRALRAQWRAAGRELAVVHLVSPAYFLRGGPEAERFAQKLRSAMAPEDKLGMLLGGWKSLTTAAGVIFRDGPTFWGNALRPVDCAASDCGVDVPLSVYPTEDLAKLLAAARLTFEKNGFGKPEAMAATGWVAAPELLRAAAESGVRYDFSAVAPEMITRRAGRFPLYQWVKGLWDGLTPHSQPFAIDAAPGLTEMPQALASVDYVTRDDAEKVFLEYLDRLKAGGDAANGKLVFPLFAYVETARQNMLKLSRIVDTVYDESARVGVKVEGLRLDDLSVVPQAVAH